MSEGSFWPKTWKEALPLIVWGILIFAAGFEGVASLVHGEWLSSAASFAIMLGLTAMLLHWKAWLAKVNPNWIAGASILLLLVIALSPYARARQWPAISWDSLAIGVLGAVLAVVIIGATTWPFIRAQKPPAETNFKVETKIDTQVQLDLAHLLDFAVCETTYWLLDDLIKKAPDVAVAGNKLDFSSDLSATYQKASDYIRHVAVQLGFRTDRQIMFANLMESAIGDAEAIIKGIPPNDRPPHIDQLDLRKFAIADLQAKRAIIFLIGQRREVLEKLIAMRHKLIELSRDWSNGNSNCISRFLANASGA